MSPLLAVLCGAVCGVVASTPLLLQLRRDTDDIGRGFGAVIVAFVAIQLAMFVVLHFWPERIKAFGATAAVVFLVCVVAAVVSRTRSQ